MFGNFLRAMLERDDMSQNQLAKSSKTKQGNISKTLKGLIGYQNPTLGLSAKYAKGFRMSLAQFVEAYQYFLENKELPPRRPRHYKKTPPEKFSWKKLREGSNGA